MFNTDTIDLIETDAFTVLMSRELIDKLDYSLSPADGIAAIDQVLLGLPKIHSSNRERRWRLGDHAMFRMYRADIDWACIGISYIQVGHALHVIDVWEYSASNRPRFDAVLPPIEQPDKP